MTRNVVIALILIALATIVLIFSHDNVTVNFVFATVTKMGSLVYLGFIAFGVLIGVLLK